MWPSRHIVTMSKLAARRRIGVLLRESCIRYFTSVIFPRFVQLDVRIALVGLKKGQTKFTRNIVSVSFSFAAFWNFIPKQNILLWVAYSQSQSQSPLCTFFFPLHWGRRFLWLDLIHFANTARNHFYIGQLSFKRKRPAWPVRTALDHGRPLDGCLCQPAKD